MTHKSLVIVESPAKIKTISKILDKVSAESGDEYVVKSSIGHIRDLSKGGTKGAKAKKGTSAAGKAKVIKTPEERLAEKLSVDPYNNWKAKFDIVSGKEKTLKELKSFARQSDVIYLATDLDREGEAIAWHLREALGGDEQSYRRVIFSEITESALRRAFSEPTELNMDRVRAQQTRRYLDRVVGFMVSPLLWNKVCRGLSAGRVQSVAVRLIVEREKEIKAFLSEEYWQMEVGFKGHADLRAKVTKFSGKAYRPVTLAQSREHERALTGARGCVTEREEKQKSTKPSAPFITSTLQQAGAQRLGFSVKKTMRAAQKLYEAGYITYMRTDSTHLSDEALSKSRDEISRRFGPPYLPSQPQRYRSKGNAQEAHEAIRPSDFSRAPSDLPPSVEKDQKSVYDLIWRRALACQMTPAVYDTISVVIMCGDYQIRKLGRTLRFDGFQRVLPSTTSEADRQKSAQTSALLEALGENDSVEIAQCWPQQHFTKPPPRYTEASLVAELEKRGIGRPSTYASIISTIQDRGYVKSEARRFFALKMGEVVTAKLSESFVDLMDYGFTAKMEEKLDDIASGRLGWQETLNGFYGEFKATLDHAQDHMSTLTPTPTEMKCPSCEAPMVLVTTSTGVFLSCALRDKTRAKGASKKLSKDRITEPPEGCKVSMPLYPSDDFLEITESPQRESKDLATGVDDSEGGRGEGRDVAPQADSDEQLAAKLRQKPRCPLCYSVMDSYVIDEHHKLDVCSQNPECSGNVLRKGKFKLKGYDGPALSCDRCEANMELKNGRFGKYFACTECTNTRKLLKNGEVAPPKADPVPMPELSCEKSDGHFILRDGAAGVFLASSLFPKSKETRKPRVEDLYRHRSELDPKHHYLADAPQKDPDGQHFVIRFSRKTKEHILSSEELKPSADGAKAAKGAKKASKKGVKSSGKKAQKKPQKWTGYYVGGQWDIRSGAREASSSVKK